MVSYEGWISFLEIRPFFFFFLGVAIGWGVSVRLDVERWMLDVWRLITRQNILILCMARNFKIQITKENLSFDPSASIFENETLVV